MKKLPQIAFYLCLFALPFITSCHENDPVDLCETLVCLNQGVCADGTCNCPDGYTGEDCGSQKVPARIRITNIRLVRMPLTKNGEDWDLKPGVESAPDLYVVIEHGGAKLYEHPHYLPNVDPSLSYNFIPAPLYHLDMIHPTEAYKISLYDFDDWFDDYLDPDPDFIGSVEYVPYADGNHFPHSIMVDEGGDVAFELTLLYSF